MKLELNSKLINSYKEHGKNPNYALSFLLNSMDPETCVEGIELVDTFGIAGDMVEFQVDDKNTRTINSIFGMVDAGIVTNLSINGVGLLAIVAGLYTGRIDYGYFAYQSGYIY